MNKNCFLITTYCETIEKLVILGDCMKYLEFNFPNFDILLYAHFELPKSIQERSTFYIYDSSNPVLDLEENSILRWYDITSFINIPTRAITIIKDAGYAVMSMWQKGCSFLNLHGYENVCILTYDSDVHRDEFKTFVNNGILLMNENDAFVERYVDYSYSMNYAIFNLKTFSEKIVPILTKQKYLSYQNTMAEYIIYNILNELRLKIICDDTLKERNLIHTGRFKDIGVSSISMFWFGRDYNDKPTIVIYDNDNEIVELSIMVNSRMTCKAIGHDNYLVYSLPVEWKDIDYIKVIEYCKNEMCEYAYEKIDEKFILNNRYMKIED